MRGEADQYRAEICASRGRGRCTGRIAAALLPVLLIPVGVFSATIGGGPVEFSQPLFSPIIEKDLIPVGGGVAFYRAAASSFSPSDSTLTWEYEGGGCRSRSGGTPFFDLGVQIPHGSKIDLLRVYYYDMDAMNDVQATLYSFDNEGASTTIATAEGAGTSGFGSAESDFFSHIVNTVSESIVVRLSLSGSDSTLRACGIRIRYVNPQIFENGFESGDTSAWSDSIP